MEHFGRTYPQLMMHKCQHCNGAGTVICPHCQGYKVKKAASYNGFRLSEQTAVGRCVGVRRRVTSDHLQHGSCFVVAFLRSCGRSRS